MASAHATAAPAAAASAADELEPPFALSDGGRSQAAVRPASPLSLPPTAEKVAASPTGWMQTLRDIFDQSPDAQRARAGRSDPWFSLKFAVGLVILVIGWTIYVFVVRVCVRMIQGRALSVGRGVAFVVIFFLLLGMFAWSYIRVLTASPGDARDVVSSGIEGRPYEAFPSQPISEALESPSQPLQQQNPSDIEMRESHESYATSSFPDLSTSPSPASPPTPLPPTSLSHPDPRPHDTLLAQAPGNVPAKVRKGTLCASPRNRRAGATSSEETKFEELERRPPRPEEAGRWCQHCQLAKPLRTHHSSATGRCVRRMDHFCPWIGQEVGQLNHKFFLVFCFWSTCFTFFILVATAVSIEGLDMDGMTISLLPLSALFTLLTAVLTGSHTWMLLHNVTTLEQMRAQDWHEAEEAALSARFRWYELGKKEAVRKRWRREWGTVYVEGNRWFVGYRRNWQGTMGARKLLWLLPLGRPVDDGIGFPVNPRVGADGGWRKRELWPTELQ